MSIVFHSGSKDRHASDKEIMNKNRKKRIELILDSLWLSMICTISNTNINIYYIYIQYSNRDIKQ